MPFYRIINVCLYCNVMNDKFNRLNVEWKQIKNQIGSRGWEKKAIQLGKCGQILSTHELIDPQIF